MKIDINKIVTKLYDLQKLIIGITLITTFLQLSILVLLNKLSVIQSLWCILIGVGFFIATWGMTLLIIKLQTLNPFVTRPFFIKVSKILVIVGLIMFIYNFVFDVVTPFLDLEFDVLHNPIASTCTIAGLLISSVRYYKTKIITGTVYLHSELFLSKQIDMKNKRNKEK